LPANQLRRPRAKVVYHSAGHFNIAKEIKALEGILHLLRRRQMGFMANITGPGRTGPHAHLDLVYTDNVDSFNTELRT